MRPNGFMGGLGSSLASSLGSAAVGFGTQALLSSFGIEEEGNEEEGGIADALVAGFGNLSAGGDGGGGEPTPSPGAMDLTAISDPSTYGQGPSPEAAPPPGEYQTTYSADLQYTSYNVELPSAEFNYSTGNNSGNNASNMNGNNPSNPWNTMANQQTAANSSGNMYSSHTSLPHGAQRPPQPYQSLHPAYHHPQSTNWNPYRYQ